KCTVPSSGSGKSCSAIIAIDKPKAVMCAVNEGAELCPTLPEAENKPLYSSTSCRDITSVVSHRVPGRLVTCGFRGRTSPAATFVYEAVNDGIFSTGTSRKPSGCGVESTSF